MITLRLYKKFNKHTNSTNTPGPSVQYDDCPSLSIKDRSNIMRPVFDLALSQDPATAGYNYCYIAAYSRYYFIDEWTYTMGIWTCYLSEDVLASYKQDIGALEKYVMRSASMHDPNIIDNHMTILPPVKKVSPLLVNEALWSPFSSSGGNGGGTSGLFIVGIQGPQPSPNVPSIGGICYYPMSYSQMCELLTYLTSQQYAELREDSAAGLTAEVVKALQDPAQFIASCMWFPWTISTTGTIQPQLGFWTTAPLTHPTKGLGTEGFSSLNITLSLGRGTDIPAHPQESGDNYGPYLKCAPYSYYKFHLEPWGDIDIDGSAIIDCERISGSINVDYITGTAALNLFAIRDTEPAKTVPLGRHYAQVGVNVGISQLIYEMQSTGGTLTSTAAGAAHSLSNLWEKSKATGGSWLDNMVDTVNNMIGNLINKNEDGQRGITTVVQEAVSSGLAYMATPARNGVNGSYMSYYGVVASDSFGTQYYVQGPYLEVTQFTAAENNNREQGRPLMRTVVLNTLSGFIKCADGDNNIPALDPERNTIARYLIGGFFYE